MATIVDCTCASSLHMEPVASTQKQISMNPKAGRGKLSRELVLKIVTLEGFKARSMLFVRIIALPAEDGINAGATGIEGGEAIVAGSVGSERLAGRAGRGLRATFLGLVGMGFKMRLLYSMVLAIVLVLVMRLAFLD